METNPAAPAAIARRAPARSEAKAPTVALDRRDSPSPAAPDLLAISIPQPWAWLHAYGYWNFWHTAAGGFTAEPGVYYIHAAAPIDQKQWHEDLRRVGQQLHREVMALIPSLGEIHVGGIEGVMQIGRHTPVMAVQAMCWGAGHPILWSAPAPAHLFTRCRGEGVFKPGVIIEGICRRCGCTDEDCSRCIARTGQACSWSDRDHTLCSACASPQAELKGGIR